MNGEMIPRDMSLLRADIGRSSSWPFMERLASIECTRSMACIDCMDCSSGIAVPPPSRARSPTSHQLQSARFPSRSFIRSSRHAVDCLVQNIPRSEWTVKSKPAKLILMTQAPVTEKGRATRERILQAAAELVAERGVAGMSLDDVRARTGTSRSQLYHYFDDRDDLVRAVIDVTTDAVIDVQGDLLGRLDSWAGIERWSCI